MTVSITLVAISVLGAHPAIAEDYIGVEVEVVDVEDAPQVRSSIKVPFGKKSDAAKISFSVSGLEPGKPVLITVSPSPDAIARFNSDSQGSLSNKVELPYGLEPGSHDIDVLSFFGADDVSVMYTIGRIYVNAAGILTESDGSYPKGTKPAQVLLPTSEEQFPEPPSYQAPKGTLRISEPQIRIIQNLLPSLSAVMSLNNDSNLTGDFEVKMSLFTMFGNLVGEPYYSKIESIPPGGTQAILLDYPNLPPIGFFTLKTEIILPDNFVSEKPVKTSYVSSIFAPPFTVIGLLILLLVIGLLAIRLRAKSLSGAN